MLLFYLVTHVSSFVSQLGESKNQETEEKKRQVDDIHELVTIDPWLRLLGIGVEICSHGIIATCKLYETRTNWKELQQIEIPLILKYFV